MKKQITTVLALLLALAALVSGCKPTGPAATTPPASSPMKVTPKS